MAVEPDSDPHGAHTAAAAAAAAAEDFGLGSNSPEGEQDHESGPSVDDLEQASPSQLPTKRKGGRKPVYATVEERKQRNRQAQAAFRERRTEYIKQLELTLKQNQQLLQSAQIDQNAVAHECSALRYKIATLEKIMVEKGIDVDAEIRAKSGQLDLQLPTPSSQGRTKPDSLPQLSDSGSGSGIQSQRGLRGLAPKLDLRSKMAQLQSTATASPIDPQSTRQILQSPARAQPQHMSSHDAPWQPPSPADNLQTSPAIDHFRGTLSPIHNLQTPTFSGSKEYSGHAVEFDGRPLESGLLHSPAFHDHGSGPPEPPTRMRSHHEEYPQAHAFGLPGAMNGLGRMGHYDFYSAS